VSRTSDMFYLPTSGGGLSPMNDDLLQLRFADDGQATNLGVP
jgi:hypothetical protein